SVWVISWRRCTAISVSTRSASRFPTAMADPWRSFPKGHPSKSCSPEPNHYLANSPPQEPLLGHEAVDSLHAHAALPKLLVPVHRVAHEIIGNPDDGVAPECHRHLCGL